MSTFDYFADPPAGVYTRVHTVPGVAAQTGNIRLTNRDDANAITVRLAISPNAYVDGAAPDLADYIEPLDFVIEPHGIVEDIRMPMAAGEKVVVLTSAQTLSVWGYGVNEQWDVVVSRIAVPANEFVVAHEVPAGKSQAAVIRAVNRNAASPIAIDLAVCPAEYVAPAAPDAMHYIEPPLRVIEQGGLIENMGLTLVAGRKVVARANAAALTLRIVAQQE